MILHPRPSSPASSSEGADSHEHRARPTVTDASDDRTDCRRSRRPTPRPGRPPLRPRRRTARRRRAGRHASRSTTCNAYYGDAHAVKGVDARLRAQRGHRDDRPVGLREVDVVRCINRMHEEIPGARAEGTVTARRRRHLRPGVDVVAVRRAIGMVFQKPNPFPTMSIFDNVAAGLRLAGARGEHMNERVEQSLRGAGLWEEVKDRLERARASASPAASSSACASRARSRSSPR